MPRRVLLVVLMLAAASAQLPGEEEPLTVTSSTVPDRPLGPDGSGEVTIGYAVSCQWVVLGGGPLAEVQTTAEPSGQHMVFTGATTHDVHVGPCQDPGVAAVPFTVSFSVALETDAPGERPLPGAITTSVARSGPLEQTSDPLRTDFDVQAAFVGRITAALADTTVENGEATFRIDVQNEGNAQARVQALLFDAPTGVQVVMPTDLVLDRPDASGTMTGTARFGAGAPREAVLEVRLIPLSTQTDLEGPPQDLEVRFTDERPAKDTPLPVGLAIVALLFLARRRS